MNAALSTVLNLSVIVFAATSMLSVGLGSTLNKVLGPLRNVRPVVFALLANFVLVPLLAFAVIRLMPLERPHALGLFLIGTAAGAPFLIKLIEAAEGRVARGATLLVLLLAGRTV